MFRNRLHLVIRSHRPPLAPYRPSPAKMPRTGQYPEQGDSYRPGGAGYRFSSSARIALRRILPLMVFGSSSTNSMMRGYL